MPTHPPSATVPPARLDPPSRRPGSQAGFSLIEVLISALIVALVAAAGATGFIASIDGSSTLRLRSDAQALAQQDESRLRGLNVDELSNLSRTLPAVSLDGATFTVTESASYVSDSTGTPSCTNPSADYLKTTSSVTWVNMGAQSPVSVSSVLTPTVGSVDPTHGTLAVSVINAAGTGASGMSVNVSGPDSATATTSAGGCALFGDLPAGTYNVAVAPIVGTDVDAKTGQVVAAGSPDLASPSPTVVAGSTAASPTQFQLDAGGTIVFPFTDAFPSGVSPSPAPTATAPAVVLFNTGMNSPGYRLCSAQDSASACPAVGSPDTSFSLAAWTGTSGHINATPLFPTTYSTYAGVCPSDEPALPGFGGTDGSASVTTGASVLTLPAMVVRLYSGTSAAPGSETTVPVGAHLIVTDTGCSMRYIGYTTTPPAVTSGQAVLPLNTTLKTGVNDTGLLTYPGMPYGNYTVCYDNGTKHYGPLVKQNAGTGEIVNLYALSATTTGLC
jgi:prepilin-type N-terminal cleavage/methylation domain-containing protein